MGFEIKLDGLRRWSRCGDVHVTGTAFTDGRRLVGDELAERFRDTETAEEFGSVADGLNGYFAVVRERDEGVWVAVDHLGTIPMFYGTDGETGYLSDDGEWVRERLGATEVDRYAAAEYLVFRFVTGTRTLYPGVEQSQPGQVIVGEETEAGAAFDPTQYYDHELVDPPVTDREALLDEFDELLTAAFERFLDFADGRTIAVSLSGGYDSRLITSMLRRLEYEDVVTFSCLKGSREDIQRARNVAEAVELPWGFADLSQEDWHQFYESDDWDAYHREGLALSGKPFVFDLPPIQALKERGAIPEDSVFVSGHTAVDPARPMNRHLRQERSYDADEFTDALLDFHHCQWDYDGDAVADRLRETMLDEAGTRSFASRQEAVDAYERWRWQERESKYIVSHHLRVYDYVGHDWWLPLYDRELMDFWCRAPIDEKAGRELYQRYVERLYADVTGMPISAARTTTGSSQLVSRMEAAVSGTSLKPIASDLYHTYKRVRESLRGDDPDQFEAIRASDPRYGVMVDDDAYDRLVENAESFEGFHSASVLGLLSFEDPDSAAIPRDGVFRWDEPPLSEFETTENP